MYLYMARSPCQKIPLLALVSTYLAHSSCDRNRPPRSQVAHKLLPFVPHCSLVPSPPNSQPSLGFPEPNVHLIRRITNPFPSIQNRYLPYRTAIEDRRLLISPLKNQTAVKDSSLVPWQAKQPQTTPYWSVVIVKSPCYRGLLTCPLPYQPQVIPDCSPGKPNQSQRTPYLSMALETAIKDNLLYACLAHHAATEDS